MFFNTQIKHLLSFHSGLVGHFLQDTASSNFKDLTPGTFFIIFLIQMHLSLLCDI